MKSEFVQFTLADGRKILINNSLVEVVEDFGSVTRVTISGRTLDLPIPLQEFIDKSEFCIKD